MKNDFGNRTVNDDPLGGDTRVEIHNGRFVDVIHGRFYDPATRVVIRDGAIESMPGQGRAAVQGAPDYSIDLQGKTVLPGLFNVHCHIQMIHPTLFSDIKALRAAKAHHDRQVEKNMADCLARGITNIRDAYSDDLRPNRRLMDRIRSRTIPGPRIQQAVVVGARGGYLSPEFRGWKRLLVRLLGLGSLPYDDPNSGVVAFSPDAGPGPVREAVDRAVDERGADLIKVGESLEESLLNPSPITMTMEQMETITDQARRRGVQSTIHSVSVDTFRRAVGAGFSSLAHMPRDGYLTPDDTAACLRSECILDPTLSVGYDMSWRLSGNPFAGDPNLEKLCAFRQRTVVGLTREFWLPELRDAVVAGMDRANRGEYRTLGVIDLSRLLGHFSRLARHGIENTRMLLDRGVPMACGNDGGIQACTPAMIGHELALFDLFMNGEASEKPFDGVKALQTATIHSARSMGLDDRFGAIGPGMAADLAVVDGDPFEDPHVIGKPVEALFVDGRLIINECGLAAQRATP